MRLTQELTEFGIHHYTLTRISERVHKIFDIDQGRKYALKKNCQDSETINRVNNFVSRLHPKILPNPNRVENGTFTSKNNFSLYDWIEGKHKNQLSKDSVLTLLSILHKTKLDHNQVPEYEGLDIPLEKKIFTMVPGLEDYIEFYEQELPIGLKSLLHTDIHPKNIVYSDEETKLLDIEYLRYGSIYVDLANTAANYAFDGNVFSTRKANGLFSDYQKIRNLNLDANVFEQYLKKEIISKVLWTLDTKCVRESDLLKFGSIRRFISYATK